MYTMHQAKSMLSKLVEEAASGKEVIIMRGNVPVARLVPIPQTKPRKPGTLKGKLKIKPGAFDPLTREELLGLGFE